MTVEAVPTTEPPPADPVLYRITKRSGKELIVDAAELARLDGLKVRAYVGYQRCKIHECSACGKRDAWREGWSWYGSIEQVDNWQGEKPVIPKWCSEPCRQQLIADKIVPRNMQRLDDE